MLPEAVPARFARLSIRSTWGGDRSVLQMGEWQVIATPGWAPAEPVNVAEPRHGGHVVSATQLTDPRQGDGMLSEDLETSAWEPYLETRTSRSRGWSASGTAGRPR